MHFGDEAKMAAAMLPLAKQRTDDKIRDGGSVAGATTLNLVAAPRNAICVRRMYKRSATLWRFRRTRWLIS